MNHTLFASAIIVAAVAPVADPAGVSFNTMVNSVALAVVGAITVYQTWRAAHDRKKLASIEKSTAETHSLINRPFGILLDSLASELEDRARKSQSAADILRAAEARRRSDEHAAAQKEVDAATKAIESNRDRIIAEFKAGKGASEAQSAVETEAKRKIESYVAPADADAPMTEKRLIEILNARDAKK